MNEIATTALILCIVQGIAIVAVASISVRNSRRLNKAERSITALESKTWTNEDRIRDALREVGDPRADDWNFIKSLAGK